MQLEQMFINIHSVKHYSNYANSDIIHSLNLSNLTCDKGYQKALIKLPKNITYNEHMIKIIARQFKNATKVVLYQREHFNHYFLDVYYIDRQLKNEYLVATSDMVLYKRSGKRMRDISKYNSNNDNHIYIKAGEKVPQIDSNGVNYVKTKTWSKLLTYSKKHFIHRNNQRKMVIAKYINKLLMQVNANKAYLTAQEWANFGLEFMYKVEQDIMDSHKNCSRNDLLSLIEKYKHFARIKNKKKMKFITFEMVCEVL